MDIEKIIGEIISNQTDKVIIEGKLHQKQLEALAEAINQSRQIKSITFRNILFYMPDMFNKPTLQQEMLAIYITSLLLRKNNSLGKLVLSGDQINDNGVIYITSALKNNKTLNSLDLSDNLITNKGANNVLNLILNGKSSFKEVDLSRNRIDSEQIEQIEDIIKKNKISTSIKFSDKGNNPIEATDEAIISNQDTKEDSDDNIHNINDLIEPISLPSDEMETIGQINEGINEVTVEKL
jgi:DNA-binding protein YbaB